MLIISKIELNSSVKFSWCCRCSGEAGPGSLLCQLNSESERGERSISLQRKQTQNSFPPFYITTNSFNHFQSFPSPVPTSSEPGQDQRQWMKLFSTHSVGCSPWSQRLQCIYIFNIDIDGGNCDENDPNC